MEKESTQRLFALSHEGRLAVYRLLMRRYPDEVRAGEISEALAIKPSTMSVYLSALLDVGLVTQRREGTALLYRVDLAAVHGLLGFLVNDCCRGRADLCPVPPEINRLKSNVLFVCTGNSARSLIAEQLLRSIAGDRFSVFSAGTHPAGRPSPHALEVLRAAGHEIDTLRSKSVTEFLGANAPQMDFVLTVCDQAANEDCPVWAGVPVSAHWGQPDPVRAEGSGAEVRAVFQQTYDTMERRIRALAELPIDALDRAGLQAALDRIGAAEFEEEPT
ncbi:helix-turn-helix domain-containing protein [Sinirhodobacter sp. HNIBRBA609]|nr:helix-turn-helix domain-containing protein [Sinirhodobacter sp. HNIBRBA609]